MYQEEKGYKPTDMLYMGTAYWMDKEELEYLWLCVHDHDDKASTEQLDEFIAESMDRGGQDGQAGQQQRLCPSLRSERPRRCENHTTQKFYEALEAVRDGWRQGAIDRDEEKMKAIQKN
eukprot:6135235-Amphidinium_carterae.7